MWGMPAYQDCSQKRVVAAVKLHGNGGDNTIYMPDNILVYHKKNSKKNTGTTPQGTQFVPEARISISMSPVVAYVQLVPDFADSTTDKIGKTRGRNGTFAWDWEMYTTNYIPSDNPAGATPTTASWDMKCRASAGQMTDAVRKDCCRAFKYPCGNPVDAIDSSGNLASTQYTNTGVFPSCESSSCFQHDFPRDVEWYPSGKDDPTGMCAAALSPNADPQGKTCWHSVCPGKRTGTSIGDYLSAGGSKCRGGAGEWIKNAFSWTRGQNKEGAGREMLKQYGCNRTWTAPAISPCGYPETQPVNGPVDVSLVGATSLLKDKKYIIDLDKTRGVCKYNDQGEPICVGSYYQFAWASTSLGANSPAFNYKKWLRSINGVVYQTKVTKCGQVYMPASDFHYQSKVFVNIQTVTGNTTLEIPLESEQIPTPWYHTPECDVSGAVGCYRAMVTTWDTSEGFMTKEEAFGDTGRVWASYPWPENGDSPDAKGSPPKEWTHSKIWAFAPGMSKSGAAIKEYYIQPMSIHGGTQNEPSAASVCMARPADQNKEMLSIPQNGSSGWMSSGALNWNLQVVSKTDDTISSNPSYTDMMLQNEQYNNADDGSRKIGPFQPWFQEGAELPKSPKGDGSRSFYWIDGKMKFRAQAYSTRSNVMILVQMPADDVAVVQTTSCDTIEASWDGCSTIQTSATGGPNIKIKNTGSGYCTFWWNVVECTRGAGGPDPVILADAAGYTTLKAGEQTTRILPVTPGTSLEPFTCTVKVRNDDNAVLKTISGECNVTKWSIEANQAGIEVTNGCGESCSKGPGTNKT